MYTTVRGEKIAEGMRMVLEERRVSTVEKKNADWMRKELASHPDFKNVKNIHGQMIFGGKRSYLCVFAKISPRTKPNRESMGSTQTLYK